MSDRVIMVTGASRGIGRATVKALAGTGARLVAVARSAEGLEGTCTQVRQAGGICLAVPADVTSSQQIQRAIDDTVTRFGRLDGLVNNAGDAPMAQMHNFDVCSFDAMMAVNCNAVFYTCRAAWPVMMRQGGGCIVNISSVAAVDPFPGFQAYGASKAWVNAFTRALADEGRPHHIRVFAVAPGAVDTVMLRQHFPDFPPEQCLAPEHIAEAVAWILDDRARNTSGSVVTVRC